MRKYSRLMCMTEAYGTVMKIDEANNFYTFQNGILLLTCDIIPGNNDLILPKQLEDIQAARDFPQYRHRWNSNEVSKGAYEIVTSSQTCETCCLNLI